MSNVEYAKLLTTFMPGTIYGLRTVVTIPSETWIGWKVKTNGNGFLDAYLSVDRHNSSGKLFHYECGLAQKAGEATHFGLNDLKGSGKWHWMYAAPDGKFDNSQPYNFLPGQQVPIELSINSSGGMDFIVNYQAVKTFTDGGLSTSNGITNARLVIGACDQNFLNTSSVPGSLTEWGTLTNQIECRNVAYQTSRGGAWTLFDPTNKVNRVYWPQGKTHNTNPQDFIVSTSNGNLTASLKRAGVNA